MPAGSPAGWEIIVFFIFAGLRLVGQKFKNKEEIKKNTRNYKKNNKKKREREKTTKKQLKKERGKNREVEAQKNKKHCFSWEIRFLCVGLFSVCF